MANRGVVLDRNDTVWDRGSLAKTYSLVSKGVSVGQESAKEVKKLFRNADALKGMPQRHPSEGDLLMVSPMELGVNLDQPRKFFDEDAMESLRNSIQKHGVLEPLVVRRVEKGFKKYEIIAGERRYRAAVELQLDEVPVRVVAADDATAKEMAIVENLNRDDLNAIEETEAILDLIGVKLVLTRAETIALIQKLRTQTQKNPEGESIESEESKVVEDVFRAIGRVSLASFQSSRLPLLNMPDDIYNAVKMGKLEYNKGRLIARISDDVRRMTLLAEVLAKGMSVRDIRKRVADLTGKERSVEVKRTRVGESLELLWQEIGTFPEPLLEDKSIEKIILEALSSIQARVAELTAPKE